MKILSLYIDKWYIVGSVIDGANKIPLSLSNAESRIWLYFYSNSTTNDVRYSLGYKNKALAGEKGYYADVFDLLPDYKEYHYEKYGARKKMSNIFADSNIIADLKKSFGEASSVPVYIAFSEDIDIVARHLFLETLKNEHFEVLQYTQSIERLALEFFVWQGKIVEEGSSTLIVNACNENLRYSLYNYGTGDFSVVAQECVPGYGGDSRKQAVVEEVMDYLQSATHFLPQDRECEEWHEEMLYLSQFADEWLWKIDHSAGLAPVALGDIYFKKQVKNAVPMVVSVANLNDRTKNIIGMLTDKIIDTIKKTQLLLPQITHVLFLGDMFSNDTFVKSLQQKIGFSSDRVMKFQENMLPDLVETYRKWDENAFDEEKNNFVCESRKKYNQDRRMFIDSQTQNLKEKAREAEADGRLEEAKSLYEQVLSIDPDDQFSKARNPAIVQQIERNQKNKEQVSKFLQEAHECFDTNDFDGAKQNCDKALSIQPNNQEALKLKENVDDMLRRQKQMETYIAQMNEFMIESRFFNAQSVLQKADELNINDTRLKSLREKIDNGINKLKSKVEDLANAYGAAYRVEDYQQCIRLCDELLTIGGDSTIWTEKRRLVIEKETQEQLFHDNYELARKARLEHAWSEAVDFAQKAISIKDNSELNGWIIEAKEAISNEELTRKQEEFSLAFANEQWSRVVELYSADEILQKKSSNATMYNKARRFLRNGGSFSSLVNPQIIKNMKGKSEVTKEVKRDSNESKKAGRNKRQLNTRPVVAHRPRLIETEAMLNEQNVEHSRRNHIQTDGAFSVKNREKNTQNKNITNKPKR